jgi:uncharacterized protein GlcG (DUF336 family)
VETYSTLKRLCELLESVANVHGIPICITIVDAHGHIVLLHRMPGSPVLALEMAERKAYTSVVMRCETASLAAQILPGEPLYSLTSSSNRLIAFGGGTFVDLASETFGVGISGGTTAQDMEMLADARIAFGEGKWADPVDVAQSESRS